MTIRIYTEYPRRTKKRLAELYGVKAKPGKPLKIPGRDDTLQLEFFYTDWIFDTLEREKAAGGTPGEHRIRYDGKHLMELVSLISEKYYRRRMEYGDERQTPCEESEELPFYSNWRKIVAEKRGDAPLQKDCRSVQPDRCT